MQQIDFLSNDIFNQIGTFLDNVPLLLIVLKLLIIIVTAILVQKLGLFLIKKIYKKGKTLNEKFNSRKIKTINTLITSAFKYTVFLIALIAALSVIFNSPFDIKSVLAAAGIGGIALGFGAQSLIKDFISGFFIIIEDQFAVGDTITIDSMSGTVEEMELRVTRIRNANGDLHLIPNGEIKRITNHSRGSKAFSVEIPVPNKISYSDVSTAIKSSCDNICVKFENLIEPPTLIGITDYNKDFYTLKISGKTLTHNQAEIERALRLAIKLEFEQRNLII